MIDKVLLAPYYLILKLRHFCYDRNIICKVHTCGVPTICVGNIAVGGTGKTPHTEMILRTLLKDAKWSQKNMAVLSRGHNRTTGGFQVVEAEGKVKEYGDEPLQIKRKFPWVTVAVDRDRNEGCDFLINPEKLQTEKRARKCKNKLIPPTELIVLDDAFQYRALKAYYNVFLVDYNRPTTHDMLLPFGRLRDLPQRISDAQIIIVTKCPIYLDDSQKTSWAESFGLTDYNPETCQGISPKGGTKTLLFTSISYKHLQPIYEECDPRYAYSKKLILFSGIAKDTPLRMYLSDEHKIVRRFAFMDHHNYNKMDIKKIMNAIEEFPTAVVATTEKDCQRILDCKKIPAKLKERLFQVPIEVEFLSEHERDIFERSLFSALDNFTPDY